MPYEPTIIPSQGLGPGLNALGNAFASRGGILGMIDEHKKKQEEDQKLQSYNDAVIQHAGLSQEELNKYNAASLSQKTGIAAGHAANLAADMAQQKMKSEQNLQEAQAQYYRAGGRAAGGQPFTPNVQTLNDPQGKPFSIWATGPNQYRLTPGSDVGSANVGMPHYDETGKVDGYFKSDGSIQFKPKEGNAEMLKQLFGAGAAPTDAGGNPAPTAAVAPAVDKNAVLTQARAKIAAGANRDAVAARLKQLGVDPAGL